MERENNAATVAKATRDCLKEREAKGGAPTAWVEKIFQSLLADVVELAATDLHIDPFGNGFSLNLRIDGLLHRAGSLDKDLGLHLIRHIETIAGMDAVNRSQWNEGHLSVDVDKVDHPVDLRITTVETVGGLKSSIRFMNLDASLWNLAELGMNESQQKTVRDWVLHGEGMVAATGPTGSGKTSTLYAMLRALAGEGRSIITLEQPVERVVPGVQQIHMNPNNEIGADGMIKSTLRLDPDAIMIGEIRDAPSLRAALNASFSGHSVLTSLHSRHPANTVSYLRSLGVSGFEMASCLKLIISQRLVRTLCPECLQWSRPESDEVAWLESRDFPVPEQLPSAKGCDHCKGQGFLGRTGLFEIWEVDAEGYHHLLEEADENTLRTYIRKQGVESLAESGLAKVREGKIALDEIQFQERV